MEVVQGVDTRGAPMDETAMKKDIYPLTEKETSLEVAHEEQDDSEIMMKSLSSSICDTRLPSYSISNSVHSSMNLSSVAFEDMNSSTNISENIQFAWDSIEEIRSKYLYDVRREMSNFKHALSLWNNCGFIPLFTNFMSCIGDANQEINRLFNRLSSSTKLIQRFVKLYKKQQSTLQIKEKQLSDIQFENNELKKENEWLRGELLNLTNTVSTSHKLRSEQIKSLNEKHNDTEQTFLEELEKLEKLENDAEEENNIENVTIFDTLSPDKKKRNIISKSMHLPRGVLSARSSRSASVRTSRSRSKSRKRKEKMHQIDCKRKEALKPLKSGKRMISHSRSVRTAKPKTPKLPKVSTQPKRKRFRRETPMNRKVPKGNPLNISNISAISSPGASRKENESPIRRRSSRMSMIPKPKSRKSLGGTGITSSIRRPAASLRRLSYSHYPNDS